MKTVYRVVKNGIDVPNSATDDKSVALSHAYSLYLDDTDSTIQVISSQVVENVIASHHPFSCRLRIGDDFEKFESEFDLIKRISQCISKSINFTLIF